MTNSLMTGRVLAVSIGEIFDNSPVWLIVPVAFAVIALLILLVRRISKRLPQEMDELSGDEFEYYCADILRANAFDNVTVTKGSGDFGADILCERDGIKYAIQCKCYDKPVGVHAVQEVYAAKDYYDRMVGVVMCNQYFTAPARKMADKLRVLLWDRDIVGDMLRNTGR
ncbi:restriction endonuclease [Butyrivibrio sp. MC2013]|uniref:restriction endonuclease n=1 Tax=Butyrivibrio sp. MC2013 TaxID=1280686 RepID=UPI001FA6FD94|nr:restriction endonuclease [Butyrivibrio sp. MC2013]